MAEFPPRVRRVELRCSDVEASAEFYSRLVGLEVGALDAGRAELRAPGAEQPLLVLERAERPGRVVEPTTGLFHTAFRYADRSALGAALGRVDELRAAFTGASDHGVSEALYLDDPDGLGIELYWDRPRTAWPKPAPSERVAMFTERLDLGSLLAARSESDGVPDAELDIGHVHLKVADIGAAEAFWTGQAGLELMARFGDQASFLALDDYHHHIGANSWHSRGAGPSPADRVGLEAVAIAVAGSAETLQSPDGLRVELEAA